MFRRAHHQSGKSERQPSSRVIQVKWSVVSHTLASSALLNTHDQWGFSRTCQDSFVSCVEEGPVLRYRGLCLSRVLADPNTLPSKEQQRPRHYRSSIQRFGSSCCCKCLQGKGPLGVGFNPVQCQGIFGRSTAIRAIPGSSRLRQRQTASEPSSRSSCQQWSVQLFFHFGTWADHCAWSAP